jgi:enoyl-CoA hydratase/carnithine racemase
LPELSIGIIPGLGGIYRLIQVMGEAKALEMILLGDMISATRALELNLVNRIFPKKEFIAKVMIFVKTLLTARREAIERVLTLAALARTANEEENILKASESFTQLISER